MRRDPHGVPFIGMYDPQDTIFAIATPPHAARTIIRISGPDAWSCCQTIASGLPDRQQNGILQTSISLSKTLTLDVTLYLFFPPRSYTGQTVAEIHAATSGILDDLLYFLLTKQGLRHAHPGEFTYRAYLNGKMDLMQAEAVNEVISGTNTFQLAAAGRLLSGSLGTQTESLKSDLMDLLSLIEAGMDFSEEDIEFISVDAVGERLRCLQDRLQAVLDRGARMEALLHLPSVGLAGVPNAGKSSLFNALLKSGRSIVSQTERTTRDVLSQPFSLPRHECVLFDCAGLLPHPREIIDVLAQRAAMESLRSCHMVLCCVDLSKADWKEDHEVFRLLPREGALLLGTKADRLDPTTLDGRRDDLRRAFGREVFVVSTRMPNRLDSLTRTIDAFLFDRKVAASREAPSHADATLLTARHRHDFEALGQTLHQARDAAQEDRMELVATILRDACLAIGNMERPLDEEILGRIFSRFCIGK